MCHRYDIKFDSLSESKALVARSCQLFTTPQTVAARLLCSWDSPGKNTGVGSHSLLQGIFPPRDRTWVSRIAGRFFTVWATRKSLGCVKYGNMESGQLPQIWDGQMGDITRGSHFSRASLSLRMRALLRSPMLVKQCLKFSKPGFSNTWTVNVQMFKLVLERAEEPEVKLPTSAGSSKKQESSRKTSISALWLHQSLRLCGSQ